MTGYVATGRITQARPRFVGPGSPHARDDIDARSFVDHDSVTVGRSRPLDERLTERWARARVEWSQLTFFLFDPNSWR